MHWRSRLAAVTWASQNFQATTVDMNGATSNIRKRDSHGKPAGNAPKQTGCDSSRKYDDEALVRSLVEAPFASDGPFAWKPHTGSRLEGHRAAAQATKWFEEQNGVEPDSSSKKLLDQPPPPVPAEPTLDEVTAAC